MISELELILRLLIGAILGSVIGYERESFHKPAGLRTHAFVTMGSTLFTLIALLGAQELSDPFGFEPSRIIAAILTGVGFIGAGVIIHRADHQVEGITTAAGLWVASGVGISVGMGMYVLAIVTVLSSLVLLLGLDKIKPDRHPT